MRPELVTEWRAQLPAPFDKASPAMPRRSSLTNLGRNAVPAGVGPALQRRKSTEGALQFSDRQLVWGRRAHEKHKEIQARRVDLAVHKLRRLCCPTTALSSRTSPYHAIHGEDTAFERKKCQNKYSETWQCQPSHPRLAELASLAAFCFPALEDAPVIITEYSRSQCRVSRYTLREVLESTHILEPPMSNVHVRWIFVEYFKLGTFWGSDIRCFQWGTDPALFEKSPIELLQKRLDELDKAARRPTPDQTDIDGYKRIGKYFRQSPGCPEYLGLRTDAGSWISEEPVQLLIQYLDQHPDILEQLCSREDNDIRLGLAYIKSRRMVMSAAKESKAGYRYIWEMLQSEGDHLLGAWDDHVERLEFWHDHTLLSCGCPRLYDAVADRLAYSNDPLRQNSDTALLYYTLARVSIENDEMMLDRPERSLNKLFVKLKNEANISREHVERLFSLQQVILDQIEYIEENKRELPIWGIPPFPNHQTRFHYEYSPPRRVRHLINDEMRLVSEDFRLVLGYWRGLQAKVSRHLDVLIQLRVLDQQDLAVAQGRLAASQQRIALNEAKTLRFQSRSVFIFTGITIVFLPLSFFTSYFSMDVASILQSPYNSRYFWMICGPISAVIILTIFAIARYVSRVKEPDLEAGATEKTSRQWRQCFGNVVNWIAKPVGRRRKTKVV